MNRAQKQALSANMCTRYLLDKQALQHTAQFLSFTAPLQTEEYTGSFTPGSIAPVLLQTKTGPALQFMRFGFTATHGRGLVLNARSETAALKPMFYPALQKGRVLVMASGFYERMRTAPFADYIFTSKENAPLLMAGLARTQADGRRFVILTRKAVLPLQKIHDRMPLILTPQQAKKWLCGDEKEAEQLLLANAPHLAVQQVEKARENQQLSLF